MLIKSIIIKYVNKKYKYNITIYIFYEILRSK